MDNLAVVFARHGDGGRGSLFMSLFTLSFVLFVQMTCEMRLSTDVRAPVRVIRAVETLK